MAVLGNKVVYNKDPQKILKWTCDKQNIKINLISGGSATTNKASQSVFYTNQNCINAYLSSNSVANTARTVLNLSDKSGWLTWGVGSGGNTSSPFNVTTWVITVDGVATTLVCDAAAEGATTVFAGGFGYMNYKYQGAHGASPSWYSGGESADPYDANESVRNYSGAEVNTSNHEFYVPDPMFIVRSMPLGCIRFETSLTVTVATTVASSNDYKYAGVAYILDE